MGTEVTEKGLSSPQRRLAEKASRWEDGTKRGRRRPFQQTLAINENREAAPTCRHLKGRSAVLRSAAAASNLKKDIKNYLLIKTFLQLYTKW